MASSMIKLRPMPRSQKSLAMGTPFSLGSTLPGLRRPGVLRYRPMVPAANAVRPAPAAIPGTTGTTRMAPIASSLIALVGGQFLYS